MKLFLLILFPVLIFAACGGNDEIPEPTEQGVLINGVVWATCNVDAPGTFVAKPQDPGMLYQWNRKKVWPATGDVTGWDDTTPTGDSWEEANDPCPTGWRLPTHEEQVALFEVARVDKVWTTLNGVTGYRFADKTSGSSIFLPAAGYRFYYGTLLDVGSDGYYWSSTMFSADRAWLLGFGSGDVGYGNSNRTDYFSIRCVRK